MKKLDDGQLGKLTGGIGLVAVHTYQTSVAPTADELPGRTHFNDVDHQFEP